MIKRLLNPTKVQAKRDDETVLDAILAELDRANPAWRAGLGKGSRDALNRRDARRQSP